MTKKERVKGILDTLDRLYPDEKCFLYYGTPWQLLFATILSAQCTDARVNIVTADLYRKYKTLEDFAAADIGELEQDIKSTGFYHNKAKNIKACAGELLSRFGGEMPCDIDELTSLPGVGRKTANVVRSHIFNEPSVVVDTHVKRISKKLGLTESDDPVKIEFELMKILPKDHWTPYNLQIITHGRNVCISGRPRCEICELAPYCRSYGKKD